MTRDSDANSLPIGPIGTLPSGAFTSTFTFTPCGAWRRIVCLIHSTMPCCALAKRSFSSEGLSQFVWSNSVPMILRNGEVAGSPSRFMRETAVSKLPNSATDTPCMKRRHSPTYSVLYNSVNCF